MPLLLKYPNQLPGLNKESSKPLLDCRDGDQAGSWKANLLKLLRAFECQEALPQKRECSWVEAVITLITRHFRGLKSLEGTILRQQSGSRLPLKKALVEYSSYGRRSQNFQDQVDGQALESCWVRRMWRREPMASTCLPDRLTCVESTHTVLKGSST